jgi:hypothetical protein
MRSRNDIMKALARGLTMLALLLCPLTEAQVKLSAVEAHRFPQTGCMTYSNQRHRRTSEGQKLATQRPSQILPGRYSGKSFESGRTIVALSGFCFHCHQQASEQFQAECGFVPCVFGPYPFPTKRAPPLSFSING